MQRLMLDAVTSINSNRYFYIELKKTSEGKRKHYIEFKMHKNIKEIITLNLLLVSCRSRAFYAKIDA